MGRGVLICTFLFIIGISSTVAIKENCNRDEDLLQRCSMALPVLSSPDISFALTREELDKSCLELHAGIRCINNYTTTCMEKHEQVVFRQIYAGIIDVVQELCTRGTYQEEYLKHADCVKNVRPEYEVCSKKYEGILMTISDHQQADKYETDESIGASHEEYLRTVCCSFQEYLMCSEATVQKSCGDEAAMFTSAFLKRMASNIIKSFCLVYRGQECGLPDDNYAPQHDQGNLVALLSSVGGDKPQPKPTTRKATLLAPPGGDVYSMYYSRYSMGYLSPTDVSSTTVELSSSRCGTNVCMICKYLFRV